MTDTPPKDLFELKRAVEFELMRANATIPPYPRDSPSQNILDLIDGLIENVRKEAERHEKDADEIAKFADEHNLEYPELWDNHINRASELRAILGVEKK